MPLRIEHRVRFTGVRSRLRIPFLGNFSEATRVASARKEAARYRVGIAREETTTEENLSRDEFKFREARYLPRNVTRSV